MKIKEVIKQTGLTDRAIRIYIENGLVSPENQKSYTGRNSFDFSDTDIVLLEQIALLRKADFSLEQIKALQTSGESARGVLRDYLNNKQNAVTDGQRILEALKDFPADTPVTVETICRKLRDGFKCKPIPAVDTKPTKEEKKEKQMIWIASGLVLALGLLYIVLWFVDKQIFPFPKFRPEPVYYIGVIIIILPLLMVAGILFWYGKPLFNPKKSVKRKYLAIIALCVSTVIYLNPITFFLQILSPIISETSDPDNYLILGNNATNRFRDDIYKLFPTSIPDCLVDIDGGTWENVYENTVRYYYRYENDLDPEFHIFSQWRLPQREYDEEKQRISNYYAQELPQEKQWGDWTCLSFAEDALEEAGTLSSYYYLLFAYNDQTCEVRYIATYCLDLGREHLPYYFHLDWNG